MAFMVRYMYAGRSTLRFGDTALDALLSHVRFAMPDETVQMNSLKFTNAIFIIKEFF